MRSVPTLAAAAALAALAGLAQAQPANPPRGIRAQALVEQALARHPDLRILALHVTPRGSPNNVIIASNIGRIGKTADADDLSVIASGAPRMEVTKNGYSVELPILDAAGRPLGALGTTFAYRPGDDVAPILKQAEAVRDELRGQIADLDSLFVPRR